MDGMELVADAKAPAETAAEFAPARAAGIDNARAGGYVSTRQARGSCTQVQGMLYAAVISGTLPLVLLMHHVAFNLPYQVLDLMVGVLAYFSLQDLRLTAAWDIRLRGGNGTALLLTWAKLMAGVALFGLATGYRSYFSLHVLLIWSVAAPMALLLVASQLRLAVAKVHASGKARRAVLVFANERSRQFAERLQQTRSHEVLGYFEDRDPSRVGDVLGSWQRLGTTADLADYVHRNRVDVVFISLPAKDSERAVSVARSLGDTTASVYFIPEFTLGTVQARPTEVASMPALEVMETPFYGADGIVKRVFDIVFSLFALTLLALPMLAIAAAVRLTSPGPALFLQKRYGLNGREFRVFKFRTMYTADSADRSREMVQASRQDSRVTPLGRFLRKTSLDELPQFINVLIGDMSVVGPRPHTVAHNEHYRSQVQGYMSRHKVKPGITGLAQVNGLRGETATVDAMDARIRYDIEYIRNWSVATDLEIVLKTAFVFLRDKNAY